MLRPNEAGSLFWYCSCFVSCKVYLEESISGSFKAGGVVDIESEELLKDFVAESAENLNAIEQTLLGLETDKSPEAIDEIFRAIHSVKGAAGFFQLVNIEQVGHKAETLLDKIRSSEIEISAGIIDILLRARDALSDMLTQPDLGNASDMSDLIAELEAVLSGQPGTAPESIAQAAEPEIETGQRGMISEGDESADEKTEAVPVARKDAEPTSLEMPENAYQPTDMIVDREKKTTGPERSAVTEKSTIRIGVEVLDELLELIGEVVLGRNQFLTKYERDKTFQTLSQSITKLHQHVIQTRMQPIGQLFNKYKRTVRDLSKDLGKKIELHIDGSELELDRTILEAFSDPLTHLVRNSVDHGLEEPEVRSNSGKGILGNLYLRARHESGQILIEVEDDGKGIDPQVLRAKAIEKQLITEPEADLLSDKDIIQFIFHPGFSTKEQATKLSGRGVGMDVVRSNLEKIGCIVDISSNPGKGTLIQTRIPLTQAIVNSSVIAGLIINIGPYTLAIPQVAVNEVIKLSPEVEMRQISRINEQEVFKLRDKLIPLVHLEDILEMPRTYITRDGQKTAVDRRKSFVDRRLENSDAENQAHEEHRTGDDRRKRSFIFIVLQFKQNYFGVLVDQITGKEEIVVKRLPQLIKHRKVFAGSTILGNGKVALILDINGLVEKASLNFTRQQENLYQTIMSRKMVQEEKQHVVVFNYAPEEYFAVPVNLLSEVDKFKMKDVKKVGDREFIQRHGKSIPLLRLDKSLNVSPLEEEKEDLIVIVPSRIKYPTGVIGNSIITNIELSEDLNTKEADENGIMGTFFHNGELITLLDIFTLLQKFDPKRYHRELAGDIEQCRILFAEDQIFFRQLIAQYFRSYGIKKTTICKNGEEALQALIAKPGDFDIVVSDIEMPVMDGYQLVSTIKSDPKIRDIPVMALTSLDSEENVKKGMDAGFDAYEVKLDKDRVIHKINELFKGIKK